MTNRLLSTLALGGLLALGACGGSGGDGGSSDESPSSNPAGGAGVTIVAKDGIRFAPTEYTATAGDVEVAFENDSSLLHNVYFIGADKVELPVHLEANAQKTSEANVKLAAGTYEIICKVPGHNNMKATLTVK